MSEPSMTTLFALSAAFLVAVALTPLAGWVARSVGVVHAPRPDRWGSRTVPLFGGVALVIAALLPTLGIAPFVHPFEVVAMGCVAALALGVVDDVRGLRPTSKFVGQVVIGSGLALGGVRVEFVEFAPVSFLLTIVWVVGMMNALNLVDNMDGLAGGIAAIAAGVLVLMAPVEPVWIRIFSACLAGAALGFLVHNFHPARVYMGDAGSLALGFALAAVALVLTKTAASNVGLAVLGPLLVLGLPIYDTALVALTRGFEGRPVSQGGRDHTSHRLAALGLSERAAVLFLYLVAAGFAVGGLLLNALGYALLPVLAVLLVALVLFGMFLAEVPTETRAELPTLQRINLVRMGRSAMRFGGEVLLDATLATVALLSAYLIRFESSPATVWTSLFAQAAPIVVPIQLAAFVLLGVYRTLWRFLGVTDLIVIARAAAIGTAVGGVGVLYGSTLGQSRAVFIMDAILLAALVAGSRVFSVWLRHAFALRPRAGARRVIIAGATEAGEMALRLMLRSTDPVYHAAGFVDDDHAMQRRRISGVPIIGRISELETLARRHSADLVVIATEDRVERDRIDQACASLGIETREFTRAL